MATKGVTCMFFYSDSSSDILVVTSSYYKLGVSWLVDMRQERTKEQES